MPVEIEASVTGKKRVLFVNHRDIWINWPTSKTFWGYIFFYSHDWSISSGLMRLQYCGYDILIKFDFDHILSIIRKIITIPLVNTKLKQQTSFQMKLSWRFRSIKFSLSWINDYFVSWQDHPERYDAMNGTPCASKEIWNFFSLHSWKEKSIFSMATSQEHISFDTFVRRKKAKTFMEFSLLIWINVFVVGFADWLVFIRIFGDWQRFNTENSEYFGCNLKCILLNLRINQMYTCVFCANLPDKDKCDGVFAIEPKHVLSSVLVVLVFLYVEKWLAHHDSIW